MNINVENKIRTDTNTLTIDSVDRNWIYGDKTCDFSFRLANNVDTSLGILNKVYKNIKSIELNSIIIPNFFINLDEVHCAKKIGLTTTTLKEFNNRPLRFTKLSDLKYITVKVDEIQTHQNGSNRVLNQASGVFILDYILPKSYSNSINYSTNLNATAPFIEIYSDHNLIHIGESNVRDNTLENLAFKNVSCTAEFIRPKDMLSSLHISFYKPDGNILELQNDTLTIEKISSTKETITGEVSDAAYTITESDHNTKTRVGLYITNSTFYVDNTFIVSIDSNQLTINNKALSDNPETSLTMESRKLEIKTTDFFSSDEYRLGDRIYLKNVDVNNTNLKVFLERDEGHTIISLYAVDSSNVIITKPNYYNVIEILPKFSKNDGITFSEDYFGLQGSANEISPTSGKLLNLDNQLMINLNINCN